MKLTLVTGSAMIKWHTLNDVFEAFYIQSHAKGEIQLACIKEPRNRTFEACISELSYSKVLSAMFNFSVRQSLAEEKYSTILQTSQIGGVSCDKIVGFK